MLKKCSLPLLLLALMAGTASADQLKFLGPVYTDSSWATWNGYWISPYKVLDETTNQNLVVYCLDYNHEIGTNQEWNADFRLLTQANAANFLYGNLPATGGTYPAGLPDGWTRYQMAAYLFEQSELVQPPGTDPAKRTQMVNAQAAAWGLFAANSAIETAVLNDPAKRALQLAAYNAVTGGTFTPPDNWYVLTDQNRNAPVQEFLVQGYSFDRAPEPATIAQLGTVAALLGLAALRRRRRA